MIMSRWGIYLRDEESPVVYDSDTSPTYDRPNTFSCGIVFSVNSGYCLCPICWDKILPFGDDYD
jgi:hypothetical protein